MDIDTVSFNRLRHLQAPTALDLEIAMHHWINHTMVVLSQGYTINAPFSQPALVSDAFPGCCRRIFVFLRRFPAIKTDLVALLDEWATRFFEELDYLKEGQNGMEFAESMAKDLPQVHCRLTSWLLHQLQSNPQMVQQQSRQQIQFDC